MPYLQVGNFEEVFRGVPEISRAVHQAVEHVNLVTLRKQKHKPQITRLQRSSLLLLTGL